ncbi:MAG: CrcB family protein [Jatrophihabitans sp.]|uniref:fluoride efflux transporter FluC n=1 Tax=Jatrophihabitans sp. TaxID=1932789 RepID=UPI0039124161
MTVFFMALAGAAGAVARFVIDGVILRRRGSDFPWATLLINATGSLLLGVATGLVLFHACPSELRLVVGTGFCGGYTTFSTASFEIVRLVQRASPLRAVGYLTATVVLTVGAGAVGLVAVR